MFGLPGLSAFLASKSSLWFWDMRSAASHSAKHKSGKSEPRKKRREFLGVYRKWQKEVCQSLMLCKPQRLGFFRIGVQY